MMHRRSLRVFLIGLAALLATTAALAAKIFAYSASHKTKKSPDDVLSVLTAYGQICHQGCKYHGPDVKEFVQLQYKKSDTVWYTHTYVSTTMRDVRYFSKVTIIRNDDGSIGMVTKQLDESDKGLIADLEAKTGRKHDPAFDSGQTTFSIIPQEDGTTKVTQAMKMAASGMLAMFGDKIEEGMRTGAAVTFKNIEK